VSPVLTADRHPQQPVGTERGAAIVPRAEARGTTLSAGQSFLSTISPAGR